MYRKNTAGQFICVQLLLTANGAVATGLSPSARRCIDGTFAAGGGTFTEDGTTGSYKYALAQADTNGNNISIIVTATGAIPVCVNFTTTVVDPTSANFGMTNVSANTVQFAGQTVTAAAGVTLPATVATPGDAMTLTAAYDASKTAAQAGDAMTLTAAYDAAKTAAQTGDAMALTAGERNSTADAILNRDMSIGTDSGSTTVRTVRQALRFLRNKWSISGATLTVFKEDDTTSSWTSSLSTTVGANPITSSDPAG